MIYAGIFVEPSEADKFKLLLKRFNRKNKKIVFLNRPEKEYDFADSYVICTVIKDSSELACDLCFDVVVSNKNTGINNLKDKGTFIMNSDITDKKIDTCSKNICLIACGLNSKSTFTFSSLGGAEVEDGTLISLQRKINTVYGREVEVQEFKISDETKNSFSSLELITFAFAVVLDIY